MYASTVLLRTAAGKAALRRVAADKTGMPRVVTATLRSAIGRTTGVVPAIGGVTGLVPAIGGTTGLVPAVGGTTGLVPAVSGTTALQSAADLSADECTLLGLLDGVSPVARLIACSGHRLEGDFLRLAQTLEARGFLQQKVTRGASPSQEAGASIALEKIQTEARRVARTLEEKGFYTHVSRQLDLDARESAEGLGVLVVEDDQDIAELLTLLLESQGFTVTVAADAPDVLRILDEGAAPDLVLLDVVLPTSNGFVILERIRRTTRLHDVPVVMVTSRISDDDVARGLRAGADGYIFKPFQWDTLHACIQSVIGV